MTDTIEATGLTRDRMTLVTVAEQYYNRGGESAGMAAHRDERTFFATAHRQYDGTTSSNYVTLIVPATDDRSRGMWALEERYDDLLTDGGLTRSDYRGWTLEAHYVTPTTPGFTTPDPNRPLAVGDRVRLLTREGTGDSQEVGDVGTVLEVDHSYGVDALVTVEWPRTGETSNRFASRYERVTEEASQEASEASQTVEEAPARTFTQEELEEAVRQARAETKEAGDAALREFKEYANGIAVEYAKNNDLCGNFERCMEAIGLMGRDEWDEAHRHPYHVTYSVTLTVEGSDDNDASDRAYDLLTDYIPYHARADLSVRIEHDDTTEA